MELTRELSMTPTPVFLPRRKRWVVGVDLGQSTDPTAICVIEHLKGVIDDGSDYERYCGLPTNQKPAERANSTSWSGLTFLSS